ncbi:MAG TPA: hypothetical protein DEQ20_04090 [Desulfobulbaceae bacterium]|nr:hypothetical protein [Desulfobulbaceae bacterium]
MLTICPGPHYVSRCSKWITLKIVLGIRGRNEMVLNVVHS